MGRNEIRRTLMGTNFNDFNGRPQTTNLGVYRLRGSALIGAGVPVLTSVKSITWRGHAEAEGGVNFRSEFCSWARLGWDRWIGERGGFIGMNNFGASGSGNELFTHFRITAENAADTAMRLFSLGSI